MKKIFFFTVFLAVLALGWNAWRDGVWQNGEGQVVLPPPPPGPANIPPDISVIAEHLEVPWDIAFLPEGDLLVTERLGKLSRIKKSDRSKIIIPLEGVKVGGEGGLLGIVLHPQFEQNRFLYLYLGAAWQNGKTQNRVERYRLEGDTLRDRKIIVENIPGALYHDGGRMEFGPDGLLYITTGDAGEASLAQNKNSLAGKILRLTDEGSIPADNPFGSAVFSYGHRNPQGLAWDENFQLWESEHGRSGVLSGLDEINSIRGGANFGWPEIQGDEKRSGMFSPVLHSGSDTWAPASLLYLEGKLFWGGLRGEALYEARPAGGEAIELKAHFKGQFGRIRTVRLGPDGFLYLTTSNRDARGEPQEGDDKIIRINPAMLK